MQPDSLHDSDSRDEAKRDKEGRHDEDGDRDHQDGCSAILHLDGEGATTPAGGKTARACNGTKHGRLSTAYSCGRDSGPSQMLRKSPSFSRPQRRKKDQAGIATTSGRRRERRREEEDGPERTPSNDAGGEAHKAGESEGEQQVNGRTGGRKPTRRNFPGRARRRQRRWLVVRSAIRSRGS